MALELLYYIFWISLFLLVYPYLVYPALLRALARWFPAQRRLPEIAGELPGVTFIISAYNEEKVIARKLQNALELDYPADKLDILVISDASSDRTDAIVREWQERHPNLRLLRQNARNGKTAGLNQGVRTAKGEVVVFSDANAMYRKDALRELVKYFADSRVGYVVGAALYNRGSASEATESEGMYWDVELTLKELESRFYSVVGGDGAIYAIRRELYWNLDPDDINDFVNPLQIVAKGYRGIFNSRAICFEDAAEAFGKEFRRKRRIVNRSWRAVRKYLGWFQPLRQARFLFTLFSHKVIRWLNLLFLVLMLLSSGLITVISPHWFYLLSFAGLLFTMLLARVGAALDRRGKPIPKLLYITYYYYLVNLAALLGIWDDFRGEKYAVWEHVRETGR